MEIKIGDNVETRWSRGTVVGIGRTKVQLRTLDGAGQDRIVLIADIIRINGKGA